MNVVKHASQWILILLCIFSIESCGGGGTSSPPPPPPPPPTDTSYLSAPGSSRTWLGAADMAAAKAAPNSPLHNAYFMAVGSSNTALHSFSGTLKLTAFAMSTNDSSVPADRIDTKFPNIDLQFASDGNDLIPINRNILIGTNGSAWRLLLEPGTVWSETSDNGWSRASFPFELIDVAWGDVRNGIATFLYNDTEASSLRVQIVQETVGAPDGRVDLWGALALDYQPQIFDNGNAVVAQYRQEKAAYLPVSPWADLAAQMNVDAGTFNGLLRNDDISVTGVVKDGVIYRQPCYSRYGDYPYCQQMRSGAFSTTKSMGAAVALLRLAQKYGDGVGSLLIKDYVNVTATHDGWDHVTFLDALDMATGIGDAFPLAPTGTGGYTFGDEGTDLMTTAFYGTTGERNMLNVMFTQGKYSWGPGVEMRYDSMHTFILSAAMDAFYKQREGADAHLWDMVVNEVYHPIGIAHAPMVHTIESDGSRGIPFLATGLYPTADDAAKIAALFQHGGSANGQQLLSPGLTATALYRTVNQGLRGPAAPAYDNKYGTSRYLMSFWSAAWANTSGCTTRVPYMSGSGGNLIALLPNGVTVFRFGDSGNYDVMPMVEAGAALGNMCP